VVHERLINFQSHTSKLPAAMDSVALAYKRRIQGHSRALWQ